MRPDLALKRGLWLSFLVAGITGYLLGDWRAIGPRFPIVGFPERGDALPRPFGFPERGTSLPRPFGFPEGRRCAFPTFRLGEK